MSNKLQPPTHGPYARRALLVHDALAPLLQAEFDKDLRFIKRGGDEMLTYTWDLPHRVQVNIRKAAGSADPTIWIQRSDPAGNTGPLGDWKNEEIQRAYEDKSYDLAAVMEKAKAAVAHNQECSAAHSANANSMVAELEGTPVPDGTQVTRDSNTGLYTVRHTMDVKNVDLGTAKDIIQKISEVCGVVKEKAGDAPNPV